MLQNKDGCIPEVIGIMKTSQCAPALIFSGKLISAREHYQLTSTANENTLQVERKAFMENICKALMFLHINQMVHVEISLDSVMVSVGSICSISYCNLV